MIQELSDKFMKILEENKDKLDTPENVDQLIKIVMPTLEE